METMHAYHDQPFADHANGFDGLATSLKINGAFGVKMLELLQRGAKEGWFTYNGRLNKAEANMGGGECGIFTTSSAYIGNITKTAEGKFAWGTAPLPHMAGYPQRQLHHRRRHAVGDEGRQARGVQGRGAVLQVPGLDREPGVVGGRDGLPAADQMPRSRPWRLGCLRQEPGR